MTAFRNKGNNSIAPMGSKLKKVKALPGTNANEVTTNGQIFSNTETNNYTGNNNYSGTNTHSGTETFSGTVNFTGTVNLTGAETFSTQTLAAAGTDNTNGGLITKDSVKVTGADGTKGVVLPATATGRLIWVCNTDATNILKLYANTGGKINNGSANAAISIAPLTSVLCVGNQIATTDYSVVTIDNSHFTIGDGAVATPAYSFVSDPDTGMYRVGANQLGFGTNGVLQFLATTSGLNVDTINEKTTGVGITLAHIANFKLTNTITAHAGGGQGSATALVSQYNEITVCASAGDSVVLPTAIAGMRITVRNLGANYADVFPAGTATIDAGSASAAVRLQPGQTATYTAPSTTTWVSDNKASVPVAQGTNITTGVTCSAVKGIITTQSASAGAAGATPNTFTVTNTFVQADSHVSVYIMDYSGTIATNGTPVIQADNRTDGTFDIIISNAHGANALSGTLVIGFEVKN